MTGRSPFDEQNGGSLWMWLRKSLQMNSGVEAIDTALLGSGYDDEILSAMKVAMICTDLDLDNRPTSEYTLRLLLQIPHARASGG